MKVMIRKAQQQIPDSDFIRVEAKLINYDDNIEMCLWTFRSTNPNVLLVHSGNAVEERFLNYGRNDNPESKFIPLMQITLPDDNVHTIEVIAETSIFVEKEVPFTKLDADGNPYEVLEMVFVADKTETISQP
jgi:hypothetical protein